MKVADIKVLWLNSLARRDNSLSENSCVVMFWCWIKILISLHIQIHTGECADRPGGGSGGQDQRSTEFSGGASTQAQLHRGDATAGTEFHRPQIKISYIGHDQKLNVLLDQSQERWHFTRALPFFRLMRNDRASDCLSFKYDSFAVPIFSHKLQNATRMSSASWEEIPVHLCANNLDDQNI